MTGIFRSRNLLLCWLLAAMVCGCAARHDIQAGFASTNSGIDGRLVTTQSADGQVQVTGATQGTVKVTTADQTREVATVDTDSGGNFEIRLRPGSYFVYTQPMEGMFYGRRVAVAPSQMTHLELRLPQQVGAF